MLKAQFIDFSLMQRQVVDALVEGRPMARQAITGIQHLLVDEYQDINPVQEELIKQLKSSAVSLFVVGDDDQSIYGWRGADVTRIQTFQNRYQSASTHTLSVNYRSTPLIVRSADKFAHQELGALRIAKNPQASGDPMPAELRVLWFPDRDQEADWITRKIQELLGTKYIESNGQPRGLTPADFAILMRSTRQNEPNANPPRHAAYTSRLQAHGIDYTLEAGGGLFDRPHVAALRGLYELLRPGQPTREQLQGFFTQHIPPVFPDANFDQLAGVVSRWARLIHAPVQQGMPRRRIYPQQMFHDLLQACGIAATRFDQGILQDLGIFSRIMQDIETVFPSIDTTQRYESILNFLSQVAEDGYDTSTNSLVSRPDAVTVSTVHKMKGLEFPVVFIVDVENQRFPSKVRRYSGMLPAQVIQSAINRGAYQSTREEEARLFYTALTRAERFLFVAGSALGPGWKRALGRSTFAVHLNDPSVVTDPTAPTNGLVQFRPQRRIDTDNLPTSYSDIKYYLHCPQDFRYRKVFGFSPAIPELFGFGKTVHTSVGKLHELFPTTAPTPDQARSVAEDTFHLKHIRPSNDPVNRPGPYEQAKRRAAAMVEGYAAQHAADFQQRRQVEERFEIPIANAVISGTIDLLVKEDPLGKILEACVIDFKAIKGGDDPSLNPDLDWAALSLQVQLYAKAAREVLGDAVEQGHVHLLKDNQRVQAPVGDDAVAAAVANAEWAVRGILAEHFPMRPHAEKCGRCDFRQICPARPEQFDIDAPPPIHVPGGTRMASAFEFFDPQFTWESVTAP